MGEWIGMKGLGVVLERGCRGMEGMEWGLSGYGKRRVVMLLERG